MVFFAADHDGSSPRVHISLDLSYAMLANFFWLGVHAVTMVLCVWYSIELLRLCRHYQASQNRLTQTNPSDYVAMAKLIFGSALVSVVASFPVIAKAVTAATLCRIKSECAIVRNRKNPRLVEYIEQFWNRPDNFAQGCRLYMKHPIGTRQEQFQKIISMCHRGDWICGFTGTYSFIDRSDTILTAFDVHIGPVFSMVFSSNALFFVYYRYSKVYRAAIRSVFLSLVRPLRRVWQKSRDLSQACWSRLHFSHTVTPVESLVQPGQAAWNRWKQLDFVSALEFSIFARF